MEKKSVAYGFALAALLMLAMSFGFSLASGVDFDLSRNSTFTNITTENITVSEGTKSNVVLTTDNSYVKNSTVLNSSGGTWSKYSNGSIALLEVSSSVNNSRIIAPNNVSGWTTSPQTPQIYSAWGSPNTSLSTNGVFDSGTGTAGITYDLGSNFTMVGYAYVTISTANTADVEIWTSNDNNTYTLRGSVRNGQTTTTTFLSPTYARFARVRINGQSGGAATISALRIYFGQ